MGLVQKFIIYSIAGRPVPVSFAWQWHGDRYWFRIMVLFKSPHPNVEGIPPTSTRERFHRCHPPPPFGTHTKQFATLVTVPSNITTWEWLFETGEYSPLFKTPQVPLGGYVNAITKERLDWAQVKTKATQLSTAWVRKYGFKPGQTVSLFSTNTIWYPVAMWAVIRAGKSWTPVWWLF